MRQWLRPHLTYANVMVTILAFLVLGGGSAVALSGSNTVFSDDIANDTFNSATEGQGGLVAGDLRPSSVGTSEVTNNSLTGSDIVESSLGQVPSATLGGLGRASNLSFPCNPESTSFTTCNAGSIDLPANSRLLIIGHVRAEPDTGNGNGGGGCRLGFGTSAALSTVPVFVNGGQTDVIGISGITTGIAPGLVAFRLECNETASGIRYFNGHVSVVALSLS